MRWAPRRAEAVTRGASGGSARGGRAADVRVGALLEETRRVEAADAAGGRCGGRGGSSDAARGGGDESAARGRRRASGRAGDRGLAAMRRAAPREVAMSDSIEAGAADGAESEAGRVKRANFAASA
mmetsp:Transcript_8784/g.23033  ORF Transcript_8784/g.23033 Transcript_8784/m.23033 type:complete len:126 (-) Transcript_8784:439-816(-)